MKRNTLTLLLLLIAFALSAQKYTTAAGGRIGTGIGLTLQQMVWDKTTVEVIFKQKFKADQIDLTLLLERHNKLIGKRLNFYVGAGPHIGWSTKPDSAYDNPLGFTGIAALEFTAGHLNLSWDFKPAVNIIGGSKTLETETAVSLRYVFIKAKKKKINWKFWEKTDQKKKK